MIWRESRLYSNEGDLDQRARGLGNTMPYIFELDNYHLILVLYILLVENAKLKNEEYKHLVKLVQNCFAIYNKQILILRMHEKNTPN